MLSRLAPGRTFWGLIPEKPAGFILRGWLLQVFDLPNHERSPDWMCGMETSQKDILFPRRHFGVWPRFQESIGCDDLGFARRTSTTTAGALVIEDRAADFITRVTAT